MPVPVFHVEAPGLLSTMQDLGRAGYQKDGLAEAGAMDSLAASLANLLLGNSRGAAVLEVTLLGPRLRALADTQICLCGGDLSATLEGIPLPLWRTTRLRAGQTLAFGRRRSGARAYVGVAGGFAVPEILGSRATFLRGRLGGLDGRSLRAGDVLESFRPTDLVGGRGLAPTEIPTYSLPAVLRVVPGPHSSAFTNAGQDMIFGGTYTLSPHSDRQGYRLTGPAVTRADSGDILSEAMPLGGLQIPPDGQPILLMADRQPTGGYPLIGVVIASDLSRAGQLAPGDAVRFQSVTLTEAHALAVGQEWRFRLVETAARRNGK